MHANIFKENLKERNYWEDVILDGRIILKFILRTGFICLTIGTSGGLL
jgi:hypothetical protein